MGNFQCHWVRDRLPLLAGEELRGADLRRVERHLIGCLKCRQLRASLDRSLNVLHAVAAQPPVKADTPSLWPELARQIRHSRQPAQSPLYTWSRRFGLWPAFGLGVGLIATVVAIGARSQLADAQSGMATNRRPIPQVVVAQELQLQPEPIETPSLAPTETTSPIKTQGEVTASTEVVPATRLGYDLDHTMPMPTNTESRDSKLPTY